MKSSEFLSEEYDSLAGYYKDKDPKTGLTIGPPKPKPQKTQKWETIYELIQNNCSQYLAYAKRNNMYIKRGMGTAKFPYGSFDPRKTIRQSANTNNIYTMFIDISPKWENYPPRSRSLICSTSNYASDYGNVYAIFPYDSTLIGISPTMDFWQSFADSGKAAGIEFNSLSELVHAIETLLRKIRIPENEIREAIFGTDYEKLAKLFQMFEEVYPGDAKHSIYLSPWQKVEQSLVNLMVTQNLTFYQILDLIIDPTVNGFQACKGATFHKYVGPESESKEVWVGGPAIAVTLNPFVQGPSPQLRPLLNELGLGKYATPEGYY